MEGCTPPAPASGSPELITGLVDPEPKSERTPRARTSPIQASPVVAHSVDSISAIPKSAPSCSYAATPLLSQVVEAEALPRGPEISGKPPKSVSLKSAGGFVKVGVAKPSAKVGSSVTSVGKTPSKVESAAPSAKAEEFTKHPPKAASLIPENPPFVKTSGSLPARLAELRVSLDYHGVLDVERAGELK